MGGGEVQPRGGRHLGVPRRRRRPRGSGRQHRDDHRPEGLPAAAGTTPNSRSIPVSTTTRGHAPTTQSAGHDIYDWLLGFTVSDPAVAESTGPTDSEDTIAEASVATTPDTVAETNVAVTPDTGAETSVAS